MAPLTWLVTGCSSGFGEQFVHEILARGDNVIATGRNADTKLAHLKTTKAHVVELDVTSPPDVLNTVMQDALSVYGSIDVLVNNAGYMEAGTVEELTNERMHRNMNTNVWGGLTLTRAVLPHMRARGSGTILWVGSVGGFFAYPSSSSYAATKHAMAAIAQSLDLEISPFGLRSILFEPGFFRTKAFSPANFKHESSGQTTYEEAEKEMHHLLSSLDGTQPGDPKKGVARMVDVVKSEGLAQGRELPARLRLGTDAVEMMRAKGHELLRICDDWENVVSGTEYE